jgi:hypothetical protein
VSYWVPWEGRIFQGEVSVEPAPQVKQPREPVSNEYMQKVDQSDVEMEKAQSSDMDYQPELFGNGESSDMDYQPELFGNGAYTDHSLSASDSEQVPPSAVQSVIEVLKVNELPSVAPMRLNDPVRGLSDELKRLRSRNRYEGHRTATDRRFWSIEQQELYVIIICCMLVGLKWFLYFA